MNRIGVIPLYTYPKDKRVLTYLQKQVQIHDLHFTPVPLEQVSCPPTGGGDKIEGKGFIRQALIGVAVTPFLLAALWVLFAFGHAMGLS